MPSIQAEEDVQLSFDGARILDIHSIVLNVFSSQTNHYIEKKQENDVWKAMITSATRLCRQQMWLFTGFYTLELSHMQFVIIWKVFMIMIIRATHLLNHSFIHIIVGKAFRSTFSFLLIFTQLDVQSIYR